MKYDIKDIINIYKKYERWIAMRDCIEVYDCDADTLRELTIILINTLIKLELYYLCDGSTYQVLNNVIKEYEKK